MKLGLGFREERREKKEKKEKHVRKMKESGSLTFYIAGGTGRF